MEESNGMKEGELRNKKSEIYSILYFVFLGEKKEKEGEKIEMEDFGKKIGYFGVEFGGKEWLKEVLNLVRENYFWGNLSSDIASKVLMGKEDGTFLIRFSSSPLSSSFCNYSLSFVNKKKVRHIRIFHPHSQNKFCLDGDSDVVYPSLQQLVQSKIEDNLLLAVKIFFFPFFFRQI